MSKARQKNKTKVSLKLLRGLYTCWLTLSHSEAEYVLSRESVTSDIIFPEEGAPLVLCSLKDRSCIRGHTWANKSTSMASYDALKFWGVLNIVKVMTKCPGCFG